MTTKNVCTWQARLAVRAANLFLALALPTGLDAAPGGAPLPRDTRLPLGLTVVAGPVNGARIEQENKILAIYGDPSDQPTAVETVLLTQARRDVTWAARGLALRGAKVVAPEKETAVLSQPEAFWAGLRDKRFHDYAQETTRLPVEPVAVNRTVKGGDTVAWRGLSIRVLDTPGYTRGAVTYLVELGGRKLAFTGDLVREDGKLQDLFSLQDAIPAAKLGGYHGWAGRLGELMASLDKVAAEKPDLIVPLRGPVIENPMAAIARLKARIRAVYANYLSIDALRWYFKDAHTLAKARRVLGPEVSQVLETANPQAAADVSPLLVMPMAETLKLPENIVPISNSRLILAADRSGFLVDCGGAGIVEELRKLRAAGKLSSVEHVFVTHYHDDHTDALPLLVAEFGASIHACGSLIDVIERPGDYRLPCLTKNPCLVTARHRDGDTWNWKEFKFTILDYPGQTLHHNALLAQQERGWSGFFAGDSFTPSGIDDYCLQNRNLLHPGQGFFRCLDQLQKLPEGCFILNQHVEPAFRFSAGQISTMRATLQRRVSLLAGLLPLDDPNYGLDEGWAGLHPYWRTVRAGDKAELALRITNHSARERLFQAAVRVPQGFRVPDAAPARLPAHASGATKFVVQVPQDCPAGLHVVVADVISQGIELREWSEAILEVTR